MQRFANSRIWERVLLNMEHGSTGWNFSGEVAAVYNFPFASLSVYVNYLSYPSNNWNFGINFGLFFQAPKLLR